MYAIFVMSLFLSISNPVYAADNRMSEEVKILTDIASQIFQGLAQEQPSQAVIIENTPNRPSPRPRAASKIWPSDKENYQPIIRHGYKLKDSYKGISNSYGYLEVTYSFEKTYEFQNSYAYRGDAGKFKDGEKDVRKAKTAERARIRHLIKTALPRSIPIRFKEVSSLNEPYLRIILADLSSYQKKGAHGYASYPNPGGAHIVIHSDLFKSGNDLALESTVIHEIGHVLGLEHPHEVRQGGNVDSIMNYHAKDSAYFKEVDLLALTKLYPKKDYHLLRNY